MKYYNKYIGMDVHKNFISISIAKENEKEVKYYNKIVNNTTAIKRLVKQLSKDGSSLCFCYEASQFGYGIYRLITNLGHKCDVIAPTLIPRKPGDKVKTDKRDSENLARYHRSGQLTKVWVPDIEHEGVRALVRARQDIVEAYKKSRVILLTFLKMCNIPSPKGERWTIKFFSWLEDLKFETPSHQITFETYLTMVKGNKNLLNEVNKNIEYSFDSWSLKPLVEGIMAMRGISLVTGITIISELGDIGRFKSPRQLMSYAGIVPSEYSSGDKRTQGHITKAGNGTLRKALIESAWAYQYPPRKSKVIRDRMERTSEKIQGISWKAQIRLCLRFKRLSLRKNKKIVVTAIGRELLGFIWDISRNVKIEKLVLKAA